MGKIAENALIQHWLHWLANTFVHPQPQFHVKNYFHSLAMLSARNEPVCVFVAYSPLGVSPMWDRL